MNKCPIVLALLLMNISAQTATASSSKLYPISAGMDRKCLFLAKQMNRIASKLKKDPIDARQLRVDLYEYQQEWQEHDCENGGKKVR